VFWLPKNATEALNAVKASIVAIQNGHYVEGMFEDIDPVARKDPRLPENGRETPDLPTGGEGRDIDAVMKRLNMVPIDPSQSALDISPKPANLNRPSHRHPSERRRLITSSKGALLIMKKRFVRQDWCQTEPLKQKIKEEGCVTRTIINRFCYGQCNSFYIPKHSRKKKRLEIPRAFLSCSFCKPSRGSWTTITLSCPQSLGAKFKKRRWISRRQNTTTPMTASIPKTREFRSKRRTIEKRTYQLPTTSRRSIENSALPVHAV